MFCSNPFQRLDIHDDGLVYCCCQDWLPRPVGNVLEKGLLEIWRGKEIEEIRESILDGSFRHCSACPYLPGTGGPVVSEGGSSGLVVRIGILKLDYDRACNLACPSCRLMMLPSSVDGGMAQRIQAAIMGGGALDLVDQIYVSGWGDPLASPLYWSFLQDLSIFALRGKPRIFLHTNGLLLDAVHWDSLGEARSLVEGIGISIDASCEETYRLNRGGSWRRLWDNIRFINGLQAGGNPLRLKMFFTFQENNFREMTEFVRMAFDHQANDVAFSALHNWGAYSSSDYAQRAVHVSSHPSHGEFLKVIGDPVFRDGRISLIVR
jgi:Iron-sulfur cluster-binding domain